MTSIGVPVRPRAPWLLLVVWAALTVGLVFAARSIPWARVAAELARVHIGWIVTAVVANFAILPLWAIEWRLLVPGRERVRTGVMFEIVAVTASVLNSIPFLAGEASAVALLVNRARLSRGAALSVLAMDQLLVAVAKLSILALAASLAPIPPWLRGGLWLMVAVLGGALLLLVPLAHHWTRLRERLLAIPTRGRRVVARLVEWGSHLDVLREPGRAARVVALALLKKSAELLAIVAVQLAFGLEPSLALGALVLAALALSTLVPVAPATLGVYEATVFAVYRFAGIAEETAIGLAMVQHLCFLLPSLGTGYLTLSLRPMLRSRSST